MPRKLSLRDAGSSRYDDTHQSFERIKPPERGRNVVLPAPETDASAGPLDALEPFIKERWISEVLHVVKSGKEATVYCCRAHPDTELDLLAAKVYRARDDRSFKNDAIYQEGRVVPDKRLRRAVEHKTKIGREAQFRMWVEHEMQALRMFYGAGAQVPVPFATSSNAILMQYLGDEHAPAPTLSRVTLDRSEVRPLFDRLLRDVELWLSLGRVHADLSAFNILYNRGKLTVIDFPQAVDPDLNSNAYMLLQRDITNLCDYWSRYGLHYDPERLTAEMWTRTIV